MSIDIVIEKIPAVMMYLVPGYVGLTIFRLLMTLRLNATTIWVNSAVLSFISVTVLRWGTSSDCTQWDICLASILLCAFCGAILAMLCRSPKFTGLLQGIFGIGVYDSVLQDAIDYQHGSAVVITLKNDTGEYRGYVSAVSDSLSSQQWISIESPCYFDASGQLLWENSQSSENYVCRMAFPLDEVRTITFVSKVPSRSNHH